MDAMVGKGLFLAALLCAPPLAANADERFQTELDSMRSRLSAQEEFGRLADHSRINSGDVSAPGQMTAGANLSRPGVASLSREPVASGFPGPSIPAPAPRPTSQDLSRESRSGLVRTAVAASALTLVLAALIAAKGEGRRRTAAPPPASADPIAPLDDEIPRQFRWPPPERLDVRPSRRAGPPPEHPPEPTSKGGLAPDPPPLQWWAITQEEQLAIERWDRSVEKEFLLMPLDEWLRAHARDLSKVDVSLLSAKLDRGA